MPTSRMHLAAALAVATLLTLQAATPAAAVSIKHTNRAGGDPDLANVPTGHAPPPADRSGSSQFDKAHDALITR